MSLTEIRAAQHEDQHYQSDEAWTAYLHEISAEKARLDRAAHMTPIELTHLGRTRNS